MEIYKRQVGYEDLNYRIIDSSLPITASSYLITATTLYFPFMLTQNLQDIGLYTDTENPVYEVVDFSGFWNLSNNGVGQNPCLVLNNCTVSFTSVPISFYNANNGSISALITGCPGPQTVKWSGPNNFTSTNQTISSLTPGSYTIKVTDGNCNMTYSNYFLTQPQSLSFNLQSTSSQTNATTPNGCNGTASIVAQGGKPPYTYLWYSGTTSNVIAGPSTTLTGVTGLCAGTYNVQITDSNTPPTIVSGIFVITEPTPISGSVVSTTSVNCYGANNGSITFNATGGITPTGYTYVLSGPTSGIVTGSTGAATFNNLLAGSYSCTIYDNVGNFTIVPATIGTPTQITLSASAVQSGCYNSNNGSITITTSGGNPPYSISVVGNSLVTPSTIIYTNTYNGGTTISNLGPGTYNISNQDSSGCQKTIPTITIQQKPRLDIVRTSAVTNFNGYSLPCFGSTTGITFQTSYYTDLTTISPSGIINYYLDGVSVGTGTPPSGLVTTKTITMGAGTHTVTAVNTTYNCSATTTVTLTQPASPLSVTYGVIDVEDETCGTVTAPGGVGGSLICNPCGCGNCRQGVIDINGGVAPYTILWSDSSTLLTSNSHCNGTTLTVTVKDANNCIVGPTSVTLLP